MVLWPNRTRDSGTAVASQTLIVWSRLADASRCPSGLKAA
jgi:hypothetical protein